LKKSLSLIELYQHDEVLRHYCALLQDSEYEINVYCSEQVYNNLKFEDKPTAFKFIVMKAAETIPSFIDQHHSKLEKHHLNIVLSALNSFNAFRQFFKNFPTLLVVHNVHSLFFPSSNFKLRTLKDIGRWMQTIWRRDHQYKKSIIKNARGFIFPNEQILAYFSSKSNQNSQQLIFTTPFSSLNNSIKQNTDENLIQITIPGSVNEDLRDYQIVFKVIKHFLSISESKLRLVLLGKANVNSKKIIWQFKSIVHPNFELQYFENHVDQELFDHLMNAATIIFLPLREYGRNYIYQEHLGYSKISGSINDVIRFNKIALIPGSFPLPKGWNQNFHTFNPKDIAKTAHKLNELCTLNTKDSKHKLPDEWQFKNQSQNFIEKIEKVII